MFPTCPMIFQWFSHWNGHFDRGLPSHEPILAGVSLLAHWATSSSSSDCATGRISHHIYVWMPMQFVYFMCLGFGCFFFFLSLSISRFSFKLLNFEYISHQWWVFHESVKRWYKSIQICISHSFICRYGSTLSMFLKLSSTRYFSIFAAVLAWLFAPLKRSGPLCRVISNSPHGWSENHRGIGPGTTGATILSRSVKTVFIARISGIHFSSNPYYIDFHR